MDNPGIVPGTAGTPSTSGVAEEIRQVIIKDMNAAPVKGMLYNRKIGVSVSDNEELGALGYSGVHLRDMTIEIVRQLLISGAVPVYGGDLRKEGYTELFSDLSHQYRSIDEPRKNHFINYFAFPISTRLTEEQELDFQRNRTQIIPVPPPADLNIQSNDYIDPDTIEHKYIWARSLTAMREEMIAGSDARVAIGGKVNNYLGKMPGIIEEALIAVRKKKPLYLVGAMGGGARQVIIALKGSPFDFSGDEYHTGKAYTDFRDFFNARETGGAGTGRETEGAGSARAADGAGTGGEADSIDFGKIAEVFSGAGVEGLSDINGLSVEENERLFVTPHVSEIIFLIFTGLSRTIGKR